MSREHLLYLHIYCHLYFVSGVLILVKYILLRVKHMLLGVKYIQLSFQGIINQKLSENTNGAQKKEENEQKNRNDIEFLWYAKFVDIV